MQDKVNLPENSIGTGCRSCSVAILYLMGQRRQNGVQNVIQLFAHILRKESKDKISVLLEQRIFSAVAAVVIGVG